MEPRLVKVSFEAMLRSDCRIVCDHFTLNNSKNKYSIDFKEPMLFNDFLNKIGSNLTPMGCKSLFQQAEWYILTDDSDEIIQKFFVKPILYDIDVYNIGKYIFVTVSSTSEGAQYYDKYLYTLTPPSQYQYTWIDKYIRRITIKQKMSRIMDDHQKFWNRGKK